jgi:hypothetical protein
MRWTILSLSPQTVLNAVDNLRNKPPKLCQPWVCEVCSTLEQLRSHWLRFCHILYKKGSVRVMY